MKKSLIVLLHVAYWTTYSLIVLLIYVGGSDHSNPPRLEGMAALKEMTRIVFFSMLSLLATWPGVIGFYTFYFILFDKFLTKRKVVKLILSAIVVLTLTPLLLEGILLLIRPGFRGQLLAPAVGMSVIAGVHGMLGLVLRGFISWYEDIRFKMELNKKNYEIELALIKSQNNPHFLFNTINNIDVLILKEPARASDYLNKLSDIMRFMLYETKAEKIALSRELSYIGKYIELQKIRTTNPNYVKYEVRGHAGNLLIDPMLFIPFIENAFKHAENKKTENAIKVEFVIGEDKIKFECENVYSEDTPLKPMYNGLGNELIHRRLALLYPNKHTFEVVNANGIYRVQLLLSVA